MIITCGECATQFQLDEARVPEAGIRVRCSVCKYAFHVAHPDALEDLSSDPVARVVDEVLDAEPHGISEATADLDEPDGLPAAHPDEESWEFSDGGRLSDSGRRDPRDRFDESFEAARDAVDDLLGSPWQAPPPAEASAEAGAAEAPPEAAAPPIGFEETPSGDESPVPELADDPWDTAPAWNARESASAGDPAGRELAEGGGLIEHAALGEALDGFESAEESDLDAFETEPSGPDPETDLDPFEAELSTPDEALDAGSSEDWGLDEVSDVAAGGSAAIPALARAEAALTAPLPSALGPPLALGPRRRGIFSWLARAGNAFGWGAVAILAAAAFWGSVAPRSAPLRAPGAQALAGLEATGVAGRWVENATLGPLYVVSGELHNPGADAKVADARLFVRLLDAHGEPVEPRAASLGAPLGELLLREGGLADLREVGETAARELARRAVAPGERIPFEAVVLELPDLAKRFDLAAARR